MSTKYLGVYFVFQKKEKKQSFILNIIKQPVFIKEKRHPFLEERIPSPSWQVK